MFVIELRGKLYSPAGADKLFGFVESKRGALARARVSLPIK
jgi:hypothetical protein